MPPKTSKTLDLDALARAIRVSVLLLAAGLAGCQSTQRVDTDSQARNAARAVDVKFNPAWSDAQNDIWERMRVGFQLQDQIDTNPRIERQRLWFMSNPSFLENASERGSPYMHYVVERLEERDMPLELALLPVIESSYNPMAVSRAQAVGLWQFIPSTGTHFNLRQTNFYDGRRDITASTNAALTYLTRLHDMFNGDWLLALAAYNAGEGTVSRAIERNQRLGLPTDYWNLPLPKETQDYVPKLLALSQLVMAPNIYGISLNPIANEPYFTSIRVKPGLDLSRVAALADLDEDELYQLNPAFKRRITRDGPQHLLVPLDKADTLKAGIDTLKPQPLVASATSKSLQQYRVRKGDSLHSIAQRYRLSVAELKSANRLSANRLRSGQVLVIPGQPGRPVVEPESPRQLAQVERASTRATARSYTVKSGDTLWQIAKKNDVDVADIKRWNGLDSHGVKPGQVLKLQGGSAQQVAARGKGKQDSATYYKVKRGDSMYLIAKRFNVEMQHIKRWNPRSGKALKPGQTLTLYLDTASR
ncbi:LysM peptidoglycan-binding domain-containing protein [Pseudomonas sp. ATCC 13867]|uniref:LysM peptidoglycan-binding domain-containing protein n=1 Tax=Pseudomonas sp. ATCC 13867 TaxID=1294143 RepID=UPI0005A2CFFC|nr:LysM peptidoglycan-binding domain-containing protein [Pseudomonas sp. ATCC 13867]RFQ41161.1 LysM peptidoglycan-binding domain-containing protein [Pseudomonas sp. ATCC 13867]